MTPRVVLFAASVPFCTVNVKPERPMVVFPESAPPKENTFVDVENVMPFVAVEVEY